MATQNQNIEMVLRDEGAENVHYVSPRLNSAAAAATIPVEPFGLDLALEEDRPLEVTEQTPLRKSDRLAKKKISYRSFFWAFSIPFITKRLISRQDSYFFLHIP